MFFEGLLSKQCGESKAGSGRKEIFTGGYFDCAKKREETLPDRNKNGFNNPHNANEGKNFGRMDIYGKVLFHGPLLLAFSLTSVLYANKMDL